MKAPLCFAVTLRAPARNADAESLHGSDLHAAVYHPFVPGHELKAEHIVVDAQVAVASPQHCVGHNGLHFLRHDADIEGVVVSSIAEAVDTDPIVEAPERHDVFLEPDVGENFAVPSSAEPSATAD
jgi:hypothetical protein